MLINEDGKFKPNTRINNIASYLYDTFNHGDPIMGDVVFVGSHTNEYGDIEWCDLPITAYTELKRRIQEF